MDHPRRTRRHLHTGIHRIAVNHGRSRSGRPPSKGNESECSGHDRAPPARHSLSRRPRPHSSFPQILAPKPWRYVVRSRPPATARCPSSPLPSWVGQSPQSRLSPRDLCALLVACPLAQTDSHPRRRARVASPAPHPHLCARGSSKAMLGRSVVSLSRALGAAVPVQPVRVSVVHRLWRPPVRSCWIYVRVSVHVDPTTSVRSGAYSTRPCAAESGGAAEPDEARGGRNRGQQACRTIEGHPTAGHRGYAFVLEKPYLLGVDGAGICLHPFLSCPGRDG